MRILVIDDEVQLLRTVQLGWPNQDDEILIAGSFAEAKIHIFSAKMTDIDCVIVDLRLPDASGSHILSEIKQISATPVIMLSAWGDSQFRADTLNRGADDYVMKPISVVELHARVNRLVSARQQTANAKTPAIQVGNAELDTLARELRGPDATVQLTGAEAALLASLASARGQVVARQDLYLKAFGREGRYGEKALETYIGRLRRKLTETGDDGTRRLQSVRGLGYRLVPKN